MCEQINTFCWLILAGVIGAVSKYFVMNFEFNKSLYELEKPKAKSWNVLGAHIFVRLALGGVAGVLVGLLLIDSIKPETGPVLRLIFLAWLAGYSAPELMKAKEKSMLEILDKNMKKIIGSNHQ